jgi:hypothetical protein
LVALGFEPCRSAPLRAGVKGDFKRSRKLTPSQIPMRGAKFMGVYFSLRESVTGYLYATMNCERGGRHYSRTPGGIYWVDALLILAKEMLRR